MQNNIESIQKNTQPEVLFDLFAFNATCFDIKNQRQVFNKSKVKVKINLKK